MVIVVGGGIGGLAAAIALERRGIDVRVYESAAGPQAAGAGIWMPPNALHVLERLGLAAAVAARGVSLQRFEVHDAEDGLLHALDFAGFRQAAGHAVISIRRAALHAALAEAVAPAALEFGRSCTGLEPVDGGVTVRFADGSAARGAAVVGADGIHSVVRETVAPGAALRYAGQTCYRGLADLELPDALRRTGREVWGGASRFGFSAVGPRHVYWFAPITAPANGGGTRPEELPGRYAGFPPPIPDILAATPPETIIRTDLYDLRPLERWWRSRVVLIGDAAHAMTPNLGQGGAQALEDALVLADQLAGCGAVEEAFRHYERLRRPRVVPMVRAARRFGRLAHVRNRLLRKLRNAALRRVPEWMTRRGVARLYTAPAAG